jgi:hypothetical protein
VPADALRQTETTNDDRARQAGADAALGQRPLCCPALTEATQEAVARMAAMVRTLVLPRRSSKVRFPEGNVPGLVNVGPLTIRSGSSHLAYEGCRGWKSAWVLTLEPPPRHRGPSSSRSRLSRSSCCKAAFGAPSRERMHGAMFRTFTANKFFRSGVCSCVGFLPKPSIGEGALAGTVTWT